MKNTNIKFLIFCVLFLTGRMVFGQATTSGNQAQDNSLKGQFNDMIEHSETYTEYKVIKRSKLRQYAKAVQDTIAKNRKNIGALELKVDEQNSQISQLSARIEDLEAQLKKSEELRGSLVFLGVALNKATYHIIVWVLICGLAAFGVFAYSSYMRSNHITAKSKKEYKELELTFEEHKKKSHERQIKAGRELQTERNKVEELKSQLKSKSAGKG